MIDGANLHFLGLIAIVLCVMVALCLLLPLSDEE